MRMHGKHLNSILRALQLCVEVPHARWNIGVVPAWNDDSLESKSTKHEYWRGVRGICPESRTEARVLRKYAGKGRMNWAKNSQSLKLSFMPIGRPSFRQMFGKRCRIDIGTANDESDALPLEFFTQRMHQRRQRRRTRRLHRELRRTKQ